MGCRIIKIIIKAVRIGAEYEGYIPYYYISGQLKSGKIISIFDDEKFDLRKFINRSLNCLISAYSVEYIDLSINPEIDDSYKSIVKGKYLEKYKIPSYFKKYKNDISPAIQNDDGTILLDNYDLKDYRIKNGDIIALDVSRFDLLDWSPIF